MLGSLGTRPRGSGTETTSMCLHGSPFQISEYIIQAYKNGMFQKVCLTAQLSWIQDRREEIVN